MLGLLVGLGAGAVGIGVGAVGLGLGLLLSDARIKRDVRRLAN